jgi:hypothetical protein
VKKLKGCSVNTHIKQKLLTQVKDSGGCTQSKGGSFTEKKKKKKRLTCRWSPKSASSLSSVFGAIARSVGGGLRVTGPL